MSMWNWQSILSILSLIRKVVLCEGASHASRGGDMTTTKWCIDLVINSILFIWVKGVF